MIEAALRKFVQVRLWAAAQGSAGRRNAALASYFGLCLILVLTGSAAAQDEIARVMPKDAEPPPLKVITKEERSRLDEQSKVKNRIKLSLELMEYRLQLAEARSVKGEYKEMFKELGRFHALVDNGLAFLMRHDTGNSSFLKHFKRYEMGLRTFIPRLELIRRELPINFEYYVRTLMFAVREARRKAVDPFFDDTVIPNDSKKTF